MTSRINSANDATLSELCSLIVDSEHKTAPKDAEGLHPLMRTTNLAPGYGDFAGAQRVNAPTYEQWTRRARPEEGDLILAREAPVGGICRVPPNVHPVLGQRTVLLRPSDAAADSKFLLYRLAAPDMQGRMHEKATGATVPHLNMADIRSFVVPGVPSLGEQRRRAAVLGAFDDLIAINERRIELLEGLARSLYREWFVRFRFPGYGGALLVETQLGSIPEGWSVAPISELASDQKWAVTSGPFGSKLGRKDYVENGVPVIRGLNLALGGGFVDDGFVFVSEAKADTLASSTTRPGDIVLTQRGTLGQVGLVPTDARFPRYVISQSQMKITVGATTSRQYLYAMLRATDTEQRIQNMAMTAGVPHINLALLREMRIVVPPVLVQAAFETLMAPISDSVEHNRRTITALARTRDLLLPRLVTGRLDISDVDLGNLLPEAAAA